MIEPWDEPPAPVTARGGARSFWSLPTNAAIEAVRAKARVDDYGFPSGHVSTAMAFVLAVALFYRSRLFLTAAVAWPLLMALSRMYLGRHFLGDVLGGLLVGSIAAVSAVLLMPKFDDEIPVRRRVLRHLPIFAVAVLLFVPTPFVPVIPAEDVGRLAGFACACASFAFWGLPGDEGTIRQRFGRVVLAALVYAVLYLAMRAILGGVGWRDARFAIATVSAAVTAVTFLGGVALARAIGWYRMPDLP